MKTIKIKLSIICLWVILLLPNLTQAQAISITSGGSIITTSTATIEINNGDFNNNGTFTTSTGSKVTFSGTTNQIISGTTIITFYDLVINNTGGVSLQQLAIVGNILTLTSGALDLNTKTLTISNNSSSAITRSSGYIVSEKTDNSSKLKWNIGSIVDSYTFPFGTLAGTYIPFVLNHTSGDIGNVTVSTYPTTFDNTPLPTAPDLVTNINDIHGNNNSANTVDRFWQIDKDGPAGTATITFTATPAEVGSIINLNAQRWNSGTSGWDPPLPGQTYTAISATVPNVSNFSPWTISGNGSLLPISMLSFSVNKNNDFAQLNWITASETNNYGFDIEKSTDSKTWNKIGFITGAGNSNQLVKYNYTDLLSENIKNNNAIVYYRLKQIDYNGASKYSAIRSVNLNAENQDLPVIFTLFPNPASQYLNIISDRPMQLFQVEIFNQNGSLIRNCTMEGSIKLNISDIAPASYHLIIIDKSNEKQFQYKLVKIPD
jgi:hypothetical protein